MTKNINLEIDLSKKGVINNSLTGIYESTGIIESVLVIDSNLYGIIRRTDPIIGKETGHESYPLYGNDMNIDESVLSPFEVLNRIDNIDLSSLAVDPKTYIGGFVKIQERNNVITRVQYIGNSPFLLDALKINQNALRSARKFIGDTGTLGEGMAKEYLQRMGLTDSQIELIASNKISDWTDNLMRLQDDGTYHNDVDEEVKGEKILTMDELQNLISNYNKKKMKTKKCHLPVTIFSAR